MTSPTTSYKRAEKQLRTISFRYPSKKSKSTLSPKLRRKTKNEIRVVNKSLENSKSDLEKETAKRGKVEEELDRVRQELKSRVYKQTVDLLKANKKLKEEIAERSKAEEALKQSEEKYSTLVEKGGDGIVIIQGGVLKFVNKEMAKITGYSLKEAIGKPFIDFVAPKFKKLVLEKYKKRQRGEKVPERYEIELIGKNDKAIPFEVSASMINYEGTLANMAILRDITERKESEYFLEEEKKKMEAIYKTIKEGLVLYDKESRIVYMNPSLRSLFGVKRNIIGVKREEIVKSRGRFFKYHLERFDDSLKTQKVVYSGKSVSNVMMKVHSKPPRYLEGNYVPIKEKGGKVVGMSASFRDVTLLKKQAEKISDQLVEVERQKNRVQAIFDNVEEGVLIFDRHLRIIEANSACELLAGCTEKEMVGRNYYDVFGCHNKLGHRYPDFDPVSKVLATKESIPYDEHLHTGKDGRERWVGVSYTPVFDEGEEIEQIVSVVRDITKIKELEGAKSEFVSLASHELRTPLTVINGYLSLLLNGDLGSLENEKNRVAFLTVLDKVKNETKRLTKLVEDLLNVSRIENGRLRLSFRKVPVVETLDSVINEFKPIAAMKGIRVNVSHDLPYKDKNVYVLADKDKFKQILVNLLDNAIKFTESGGSIKTESFLKGDKIQINIEDSGIGIDPNILPRIFEKFQQVHGSYLKENIGTGLGLFIVKSLVDLHNGEVTVDSKVGKGTTFSFTLPIVATH